MKWDRKQYEKEINAIIQKNYPHTPRLGGGFSAMAMLMMYEDILEEFDGTETTMEDDGD